MDHSILELNEQIKSEAYQLLYQKGLHEILQKYGSPYVSGSYSLDLMTWRDLDIYLQVNNFSAKDHFSLGGDIAYTFQPIKMHYRNEFINRTNGLPLGFYWGIYLGDERAGAWKIDVWCVEQLECKRLLNYGSTLKDKITPEAATDIMIIKSQCWSDPQYRRSFTSTDIYTAVLENNIRTPETFKEYLELKKKLGEKL